MKYDYIKSLGIEKLAEVAGHGNLVRVVVVDNSIPNRSIIRYDAALDLTGDQISDHSSEVGSILVGSKDIEGLCPDAIVTFINVFSNGFAKPETIAKAIMTAVDRFKAHVMNLSLGLGVNDPLLEKACYYAEQNGVILVAAAGNDGGSVLYPAALPCVLSVGSASNGSKSELSNTRDVDIVTDGTDLPVCMYNGRTTKKNGTSFSAAVVSGIITLIIAKNMYYKKSTSKKAVRGELISMSRDIGPAGWDKYTGYGVIGRCRSTLSKMLCRLMENPICDKIKSLMRVVLSVFIRRRNK